MTKMSCFSALLTGKSKISKVTSKIGYGKKAGGNEFQKVKPVEFVEGTDTVDIGKGGDIVPACDTKVIAFNAAELACEGRDEDDDKVSMKSDPSDVDLAATGADSSSYNCDGVDKDDGRAAPDASESGVGLMAPRLERSCSNIETARCGSKAFDLPAKLLSYGDLEALPFGSSITPIGAPDASPTASVKTTCSADHVMLKKSSSGQVLPSRSRKLWWRLFLRSHRNLHRPAATIPALPSAEKQNDGYTSDTLDEGAATADSKNKGIAVEHEPIPNLWMAFSSEATSMDRVSAWVNSLRDGSFKADEEYIVNHDDDDDDDDDEARPHCLETGEPSSFGGKGPAQARRRVAGEAIKASSIIQTLTTSSSVAHISGMGLTVIPVISPFSSLRAVNLSGNIIVHITSGSLPKGLHSLDLSRNKIATIEGLRELTRLRVFNLSYNKISRIGHGLSNCGAIRELYLAGNKISDVEGLHRLLKLAVVDLSFNKITTTKALGQLVANYSSLRALNLVGNPLQTNIGDDALRKAVSGLLSRLEYLNKQPVRPQRSREAAKDSVAKAALGNRGWSSRRRPSSSRRLSQSPGSSAKNRGRDGSGSRSRSRSKSRPHQGSNLARRK